MVWCCEKCQSGTVVVWCCENCQYVGLGLWWCGAVRSVTVSTLVWDCDGVVL